MVRKKLALAIIGAMAFGLLQMGSSASAHGGPLLCSFTSATGLPSSVNNVEGKGGTWSVGSHSWWAGSEDANGPALGGDNDPMKAESGDGFGHAGQTLLLDRRGLYYPLSDPDLSHATVVSNPAPWASQPSFRGDHFNWTNNDTCDDTGDIINAKGVGIGYCGRSVGLGIGTTGGHLATTQWESVGSQLVLTHPSALGTLNANPLLTSGSCLGGTAVQFQLNGAIIHN